MLTLCKKCLAITGSLTFLAGIGFLLQNLNVWNFWNLNWWTVAFLLVGLSTLASRFCPKCLELRDQQCK